MGEFHVGIKAVILRQGKVLTLEKVGGYSTFDLPGGRMEPGESPESALIRELHEELPGISEIKIGPLLELRNTTWKLKDGNELLWAIYLVDCKLPGPIRLSDEHSRASWEDANIWKGGE